MNTTDKVVALRDSNGSGTVRRRGTVESSHRPDSLLVSWIKGNKKGQACGLTFLKWELRDSNPRPSACKADALNQLS